MCGPLHSQYSRIIFLIFEPIKTNTPLCNDAMAG